MTTYTYTNFLELKTSTLSMILTWRNNNNIRCMMNNSNIITPDQHASFVESLKRRSDCKYWLVKYQNRNIGVISITHLTDHDGQHGFYLNPNLIGQGYGNKLIEAMLHMFFNIMHLTSIYSDVHLDNKASLAIHRKFGFEVIKEEKDKVVMRLESKNRKLH